MINFNREIKLSRADMDRFLTTTAPTRERLDKLTRVQSELKDTDPAQLKLVVHKKK